MSDKIPVAPIEFDDRVDGQKYIFNGEIRIWRQFKNRGTFFCEHNRQPSVCRTCAAVICQHQKIQHLCQDCFYKCDYCDNFLCRIHHRNTYVESDFLQALDIVYNREGASALSFDRLKEINLYYPLYGFGWSLEKIYHRYGISSEHFREKRRERKINAQGHIDWNEEKIYEIWDIMVEYYGYVPTAVEIREDFSQFGSIFSKMGELDISIDKIRSKYPENKYGPNFNKTSVTIEGKPLKGFKNRTRWTDSVNGMRWHSKAEARVSNFLYARGINHKKGELYPDDYSANSDYSRGWYDIHFEDINGRIIDLEIWGNMDEDYAKKRKAKEEFNVENPNFLGIDYNQCTENGLTDVFEPYIGIIQPFIFIKPEHKVIQTSFWTDADELIDTCRLLASQQSDGIFPSEQWLRKRGGFKDRDGETYNTLAIYITRYLGGMKNLRRILGEGSGRRTKWNRESVLLALDKWMDDYGINPLVYYNQKRHSGEQDEKSLNARKIYRHTLKHVGTFSEAMVILGYSQEPQSNRWVKE
jgi:hypothetical protein